MKICKKCGIEKDALQFRLRKRKSGNGYYRMNQCKSCEKECGRIYYHKYKHTEKYEQQKKRNRVRFKENGYHKHRYKIWGRNYKLQKEFGITESDYKKMLKEQKGLCAICEQPETRYVNCSDKIRRIRPLSIDHDHKTGKVRALLCDKCNNGIARFDENVEFLANAISYIEKHKKAGALMEAAG